MTRLRHALALVTALVLVGACGGAVPGGPDGPGSTDNDLGDFTFPPFVGPTNRPSGAQVRVANLYSPVTSEPGAIDVYGDAFVTEGAAPLVSVPYGTLSDFFDPTAMDEEGNGFLTFMPAGLQGSDDQLMSQSFTLRQGDVMTVFVATAEGFDGGFGVATSTFDHHPDGSGIAATPAPGNGLLTVVSTGLDKILSGVEDEAWFVSFGNGCEPGVGNEPGSGITSGVGAGQTGASFDLPPGPTTVTIHAHPDTEAPTCTTPPIAEGQVEGKAGVTAVMFLYAPKDGDLRSMLVSLEP